MGMRAGVLRLSKLEVTSKVTSWSTNWPKNHANRHALGAVVAGSAIQRAVWGAYRAQGVGIGVKRGFITAQAAYAVATGVGVAGAAIGVEVFKYIHSVMCGHNKGSFKMRRRCNVDPCTWRIPGAGGQGAGGLHPSDTDRRRGPSYHRRAASRHAIWEVAYTGCVAKRGRVNASKKAPDRTRGLF